MSRPPLPSLVLFDIDGTLMRCGRQVGRMFLEALRATFGTVGDLSGYSFGGKTDPEIVLDLMTGAGFERSEIEQRLPEMQKRYLGRVAEGLDVSKMEVLPGARNLVEKLAEEDSVQLGLVTGNWEVGARAKLETVALSHYFPFGGFGDDGPARRNLPLAALKRAAKHHERSFAPAETLIIGDTVHDVDCAQANGIPVLAVASGFTEREALEATGASWVIDSLDEVGVEGFAEGWQAQ